jgi:hypothetical protein
MYLVLTVITAATAAIVFFEDEFRGVRPVLEELGTEPVEECPMTPQQRDAELRATHEKIDVALAALGVNLANPLSGIFRLGT